MAQILPIAIFEFRYQIRQPAFYLFICLILGQGVWFPNTYNTLYSYSNPASLTYTILSSLGVMLAMAAVLLAGQSLTKDIDYRVAPYLYTMPITSRVHFAGRFLGIYATVLMLAVFFPLGTQLSNLVNPSENESVPWMALADGFISLLAPNLFIVVSITFSLTVFLRSIRGAYLALFLIVLYFLLAETSADILSDSDLWQLLDPFGVGMARASAEATNNTPDELLTISGMLLINRLLWIGLAMGFLAKAEARFSFESYESKRTGKPAGELEAANTSTWYQPVATAHQQFDTWATLKAFGRISRLEFLNLVRQPAFQITTGLLILLSILLATVFAINPDFPELPITSRMTALRLPMGLFIGLFVLIMTGELIFHERTIGFWAIYDALPQPAFVLILAKLLALTIVTALLTGILFLTGLGIQFSHNFTNIDWQLYTSDLISDGFSQYVQLIALGGLVTVLTNNRLLSHVVNLLIFLVLGLTYMTDVSSQYSYLYSFLPGSLHYSDLIGYGTNEAIRSAVQLIWWGLAGIFLSLTLGFWNRGIPIRLGTRAIQWQRELRWSSALWLVVFSAMLLVGIWQIQQKSTFPDIAVGQHIRYKTTTVAMPSLTGQTLTVQIRYHPEHPYQLQHIIKATQAALRKGESLFGPFPYRSLQIVEMPANANAMISKPGQILISEKQGWSADYKQPQKLDYMDYLVSREVFKQWLVHRLHLGKDPGSGFVRQSLAEYLALQQIAQHYGQERLKQRLAQRTTLYTTSRYHNAVASEKSLLQSTNNDANERGRAALALTSIGQVWGNGPLSLTIGQFYKQGVQQPASATATAFATQLTNRLPDSLRYLTNYLREPFWFDFRIGRVANLPNGLTVEIVSKKWQESRPGQRQSVSINDFVPLAVLDKDDREIYHKLVHPNPDQRFVSLPALPNARKVIIDPLGTWLESNKRDNVKIF